MGVNPPRGFHNVDVKPAKFTVFTTQKPETRVVDRIVEKIVHVPADTSNLEKEIHSLREKLKAFQEDNARLAQRREPVPTQRIVEVPVLKEVIVEKTVESTRTAFIQFRNYLFELSPRNVATILAIAAALGFVVGRL